MSDTNKCLKETSDYSAEDAKFMEMAINLSIENIDSGGGPFGAVIVKDGEIIYQDRTIQEKQADSKENLAHLDDSQKRLINPHYYKCDISDALYDLKNKLIDNLVKEIEEL